MNRRPALMMGLLALASMPASAGPVYGTVRQGNAGASNLTIRVACPGFAGATNTFQATTDAGGSYSLFVSASPPCEMRVELNGRVGNPFPVFVSGNAVRFDFSIDGALGKVP